MVWELALQAQLCAKALHTVGPKPHTWRECGDSSCSSLFLLALAATCWEDPAPREVGE